MRVILRGLLVVMVGAAMVACESIPLAPGADQVRLTRNPADVSSCKPVGNVSGECSSGSHQLQAIEPLLRNHTVGLGGNTVFVTVDSLGIACEGVAYHCP
jgi:hypothetical protein